MKKSLVMFAMMLAFAACDSGTREFHVAYIDPALASPEGNLDGWTGGNPWTAVDADGALLDFPINTSIPDGATIVGFEVRWYQESEGEGDLSAVLVRKRFGGAEESISEPVWIGSYGQVTTDSSGDLDVEFSQEHGYRVVLETTGPQRCRVYELLVFYYVED